MEADTEDMGEVQVHVCEQVNGMGSYASMGVGVNRAIEMGTWEEGEDTDRWLPLPRFTLSLR